MIERAARTTGVQTRGPNFGALAEMQGDGALHISQQDLDVLAETDYGPDAVDPEESDLDKEGVDLDLPVPQDPQGQYPSTENQGGDTTPEIPDDDGTMDSTGREDNGVVAGAINIPGGYPHTTQTKRVTKVE